MCKTRFWREHLCALIVFLCVHVHSLEGTFIETLLRHVTLVNSEIVTDFKRP